MEVGFWQHFFLLVFDKVIIGGIAFYLWHLYRKSREREGDEKEIRRKLEEQNAELIKEKRETELNERINFLEQQLDRFYWPMSLCMKNDDAVWKKVPLLYHGDRPLPTEAGKIVEQEFLIPNHGKAVCIIEKNFHLIGDNETLIKELVKYIRHVAVFKSLRLAGSEQNPIDVDEPFPAELVRILDNETQRKVSELEVLRKDRWKANP